MLKQLLILDSTKKRRDVRKNAKGTHERRVSLYEVIYKFGDGATETMMQLWQTSDKIKQSIERLEVEAVENQQKIIEIIFN